jgi:micrococcal nuclease
MKKLLMAMMLLFAVAGAHANDYPAQLVKVIDGDTVDVLVSLGLDTFKKERIRLALIDAPEMDTPEGPRAKDLLRSMLEGAKEITISTRGDKRGKYGRLLAIIEADGVSINEVLVKNGW